MRCTSNASVIPPKASDMQVKLQSSFDWMKYLEKNVQTHLEDRLPVILTAVVDKALAPTLTKVLADCLLSTFTSVLEGSMADFQSRFGSADSAVSTQHVRELALVCFMASRRLRIFLFMGQMFQMPSLRLLHRNRGFISDWIRHSMSGGPSTGNAPQYLMAI